MSENWSAKQSRQNLVLKIISAITAILIFSTAYIIQKEMRQTGVLNEMNGPAGTESPVIVNEPSEKSGPAETNNPEGTPGTTGMTNPAGTGRPLRMNGAPAVGMNPQNTGSGAARNSLSPENANAMRPQYRPQTQALRESPASSMFGQTVTRSNSEQPPVVPQTTVQQLQAPVTQVHSLSEAEEVMGAPASELGEVGVTRTFRLPDQGGEGQEVPPPIDPNEP